MKKLMGTYLFCRLQSDFKHTQKRLVWLELPKTDIVSAAAKDAKETPKQDENSIDRNKAEYVKLSGDIGKLLITGTNIDEINKLISTEVVKITTEIAEANLTKAEKNELRSILSGMTLNLNLKLADLARQKTEEVKTETKGYTDRIWDAVKANPISAIAAGAAGAIGFVAGPVGAANAAASVYSLGASIEGGGDGEAAKTNTSSADEGIAKKKQEAGDMMKSKDEAIKKQGAELLAAVNESEAQEKKMKEAEVAAESALDGLQINGNIFKGEDYIKNRAAAYEALVAAYLVNGEEGIQRMKDNLVNIAAKKNLDRDFEQENLNDALINYGVDISSYNELSQKYPNMQGRDMVTAALYLMNAKSSLSSEEFEEYKKYIEKQLSEADKKGNKTLYGGDNAFSKEILPIDKFKSNPNINTVKTKEIFDSVLAHFATPEAMKDRARLLKRVKSSLASAGIKEDQLDDAKINSLLDQAAESYKKAAGQINGRVGMVLDSYKPGSPLLESLKLAEKSGDKGGLDRIKKEIETALLPDIDSLQPGKYEVNGVVVTVSPLPHKYIDVDTSNWNKEKKAAPSGAPSSPGSGRGGMKRKKGKEKGPKGKEAGGAVAVSTPSKEATDIITQSANIPGMKLDSSEAVAGMLNGTPKDSLTAAAKRDLEKQGGVTIKTPEGTYQASWDSKKGQFVAEGSSGSPSDQQKKETKKKETSA